MATLLVTFGRRDGPLEELGNARTVSLAISGSEATTEVPDGCNVVTLLPDADCWVAGGTGANAENSSKRRPLAADAAKRFSCRSGQTISVVQRT